MFCKSKKFIASVIALALFGSASASIFAEGVSIKENEKCVSLSGNSPFGLNPWLDASLLTVGIGATTGAYFYENYLEKNASPATFSFDLSDVNALDAKFARPYNDTIHKIGTMSVGVNLMLLPAAVFGTEMAFGNLPLQDLGTIVTMYSEAFFLAYGIKDSLKVLVRRTRPYMYFPEAELPLKISDGSIDWSLSFPSGHTTNAFLGATFLSYVFCSYYPESKFKIPVIATSYAFAVGTGILRVLSGNHFVTDVCAGAVIGTVCGFAVPFLHTFFADGKSVNNNVAVSPFGVSVRFTL